MARRTLSILLLLMAMLTSVADSAHAQAATPPPPPPVAAQQQPAPQAPVAVRPDDKSYKVGTDDKLSIAILLETDLPKDYTVASDGMITFPFIGSIKVADLTIREIEAEIKKRLIAGKYYESPQVVVNILEYRSQEVTVMGQVATPGQITLQGSEMTLTRVLAKAGLSPLAGSYVEIRRPKPGVVILDPAKALEGITIVRYERRDIENGVVDPALQSGDTVYVPKAPAFFIEGFVKQTGQFTWTPDLTIGRAISMAGGYTERGSRRGIKIRREVDGVFKEFSANENTKVLENDRIEVRQKRF
ncbi:MAG: polysaccharide export protein [Acidobacteriota bacterium]|nr:polysaccharide export protein [Acidobacteriota bacterium]